MFNRNSKKSDAGRSFYDTRESGRQSSGFDSVAVRKRIFKYTK